MIDGQRIACRLPAGLRRLDADRPSLLPGAGQAALRRATARPSFPAIRSTASALSAPPTARSRLSKLLAARACGRRRRPVRRRVRRQPDDELRRRAGLAAAGREGPAVDRLPERRDGQGRRARGARKLPLGRASEALHHARHGDRPGQDLQPERPCAMAAITGRSDRRDRHHHLPAALHAGAVRGRRRPPPRRVVQPGAPAAAGERASRRRRRLPRIWRLAAARLSTARATPTPKSSARRGRRARPWRSSTARRSARSR